MGYYGTGTSMTGYYGDPSFWGALKGAVVGYVTSGFNPAGAIVGAVGGSMGSGVPPGGGSAAGAGMAAAPPGRAMTVARGAGRWMVGHPVLTAAGAAGTVALGETAMREIHGGRTFGTAAASSSGQRGFHIERRGKHAGQWIRNRRMRVTNPKALRRAIRRTSGFAKLAMRTIHLVHPQKKVRFGGFRKHRRRAR